MKTINKIITMISMIALLSLSVLATSYGEGYKIYGLQAKQKGSNTIISGNLYDASNHVMRVRTQAEIYCDNKLIATTTSTPDRISISVKKSVCPIKSKVYVKIGDYESKQVLVKKINPERLIPKQCVKQYTCQTGYRLSTDNRCIKGSGKTPTEGICADSDRTLIDGKCYRTSIVNITNVC